MPTFSNCADGHKKAKAILVLTRCHNKEMISFRSRRHQECIAFLYAHRHSASTLLVCCQPSISLASAAVSALRRNFRTRS